VLRKWHLKYNHLLIVKYIGKETPAGFVLYRKTAGQEMGNDCFSSGLPLLTLNGLLKLTTSCNWVTEGKLVDAL
jgi:hypothetical protein